MLNWDRASVNTIVNEKVFILSKTILNILSHFIPHETFSKNKNKIQYLRRLKLLQEDLHNEIEVSKSNHYFEITYKLTHIQKNTKTKVFE